MTREREKQKKKEKKGKKEKKESRKNICSRVLISKFNPFFSFCAPGRFHILFRNILKTRLTLDFFLGLHRLTAHDSRKNDSASFNTRVKPWPTQGEKCAATSSLLPLFGCLKELLKEHMRMRGASQPGGATCAVTSG